MKFILGKKNRMTQIWQDDKVIPCTAVDVGPCFVTQIKNDEVDGYKAIQVSYGNRKPKNISKPVRHHLKKAIGREDVRFLREFRVKELSDSIEVGKLIDASTFSVGDKVKVVSTSKGKGFQGVVRRHGFAGTKKTHGNKDQLRASGSIGAIGAARVFKGTRMGGRMGGDRVTVSNLEIVEVDLENNILFVKGAIPGHTNSLVMIKGEGDLIIKDYEDSKEIEVVEESPVVEEEKKEEVELIEENPVVEEEKKEEVEDAKKEVSSDKK